MILSNGQTIEDFIQSYCHTLEVSYNNPCGIELVYDQKTGFKYRYMNEKRFFLTTFEILLNGFNVEQEHIRKDLKIKINQGTISS